MPKFSDILGYAAQKEQLVKICDFLKNTQKYRSFGAELPKGMYIFGARGVGKSLMARALAEECGRESFIFDGSCGGVKSFQKFFNRALRAAPSVVLLEDIDYFSNKNEEALRKEICVAMNYPDNGDVFFIATAEDETGIPDFLLSKLLFPISIRLDFPSYEEGCLLSEKCLKEKGISLHVPIGDLAHFCLGWTYKAIEQLLSQAACLAVYEGANEVGIDHIVRAGLALQESELARGNREDAIYHEAGHAAAALLLGKEAVFAVLTDGNLCRGYCVRKFDKERSYLDKQHEYAIGLAGKASEERHTGVCSIGTVSDLKKVSEAIRDDITACACGGFDYYGGEEQETHVLQKVRGDMQAVFENVQALLSEHWKLVEMLADALRKKHYLLASEIACIYREYLNGGAEA